MVIIIDYHLGNIGSIINMLKKIGIPSLATNSVEDIMNASKLIIPGVGNFETGMRNLRELNLIEPLTRKVLVEKTPVLGICLGMQLMTKKSEEGNLKGLGWIDAEAVKFSQKDNSLKIPHIGWNYVLPRKESKMLRTGEETQRFYFVHSYHVRCEDISDILAITDYHGEFISAFEKDNIYGVQFHPEKSHRFGMNFFSDFAKL